jgi:16S rRNA C967 or C1407 C5-methylase (RsmB/RsmF family)
VQLRLSLQYDKHPPPSTSASVMRHHTSAPEVRSLRNYRRDMQGRVQHVRRATGAPDDLPRLQKQLLMRGFDILAPGGRLIYATCTYNLAESEAVVQGLLGQRPPTSQPITLPVPHSPGLLQWQEYTYDARMQHCLAALPPPDRFSGILRGQHACLSRNAVLY